MDINNEIGVTFSAIPSNNYVSILRNKGFEVHVFERIEMRTGKTEERRIVAIKFPYPTENGEIIYDAYDSKLEERGLFAMRTLSERDIKVLQDNPTFHYQGP
ncbi:MAG: hypothetical protein LBD34_03515 [Puniceicoccales bacterium]|jgi:hypothetical protein|nr:hypothetical protein [Puniceicoccales bacterium]